jgi:hypothetical protein
MQQAQSWEQLHAILTTNGLRLHPRRRPCDHCRRRNHHQGQLGGP